MKPGLTLIATVVALTAGAANLQSQEPPLPATPYMGGPVELVTAPNGAIANKLILDGIGEVGWVEPTIEEPVEGIWVFGGYGLAPISIIDTDEGLIAFDTGDTKHDGEILLEAIRFQEIGPYLTARGLIQFNVFMPSEGPDAWAAQFVNYLYRLGPTDAEGRQLKADRLAASTGLFKLKGDIGLDLLLFQSVFGPIGQPAAEAVYPSIATTDGQPMNAQNDYVIRMTADELPPAKAFWSLTLYDTENGFFIPSDRKKYSVGENGGMQLDENSGIAVYVAAEKPEGVPEENWLPVNRGDYDIDVVLRLYVPDLEQFETWTPPTAKKL